MLKKTTLLVAGLSAAALFAPAMAQDTAAPAAEGATEKVELRMKLQKGQKFAFRQTMDMTQDMDMQGMQLSTVMKMTSDYVYDVLDVTEAGTADVRISFGRVHGSMENPMFGAIEFDSEKEAEETGNPMIDAMAGAFTVTSGLSVEITMDAKGEISSVRGVEKLVEKMLEANPMAAMGGMDAESMGDQMKENLRSLTGDYPADAIGVGSTWEISRNMSQMGMEISMSSKNKVTSLDADAVVVDADITGDMGGGQMAQMFTVDDFSGTSTTTISRADGLVKQSTAKMKMKASINGGAQGQGGMVMDITAKVERIAVPAAAPVTPSGGDADKDDAGEDGMGDDE